MFAQFGVWMRENQKRTLTASNKTNDSWISIKVTQNNSLISIEASIEWLIKTAVGVSFLVSPFSDMLSMNYKTSFERISIVLYFSVFDIFGNYYFVLSFLLKCTFSPDVLSRGINSWIVGKICSIHLLG
jgi:hypothetical protein